MLHHHGRLLLLSWQQILVMLEIFAYLRHRRFQLEAKHVPWITVTVGAALLVPRVKARALPVSRRPTLDMPVVLRRLARVLVNMKGHLLKVVAQAACVAVAPASMLGQILRCRMSSFRTLKQACLCWVALQKN